MDVQTRLTLQNVIGSSYYKTVYFLSRRNAVRPCLCRGRELTVVSRTVKLNKQLRALCEPFVQAYTHCHMDGTVLINNAVSRCVQLRQRKFADNNDNGSPAPSGAKPNQQLLLDSSGNIVLKIISSCNFYNKVQLTFTNEEQTCQDFNIIDLKIVIKP